jgi:hypothetical protein
MVYTIHVRVLYFIVLGPFAKLRNAIISFVIISVRTSVRMGLLGCRWTDVHEN